MMLEETKLAAVCCCWFALSANMGKGDICGGGVMGGWEVDEEVRLMERKIVVVYLPIDLSRSGRKLTDITI